MKREHTHLFCRLLGMMLILTVGGLQEVPVPAQTISQKQTTDQASNIISGTVEEITSEFTKVRIKTDLGKSLLFEVTNPMLLQDMAAGDQITIELNQEGKAKKVTKMTIPELKAPPRTK